MKLAPSGLKKKLPETCCVLHSRSFNGNYYYDQVWCSVKSDTYNPDKSKFWPFPFRGAVFQVLDSSLFDYKISNIVKIKHVWTVTVKGYC
jgi:hypothetical protein